MWSSPSPSSLSFSLRTVFVSCLLAVAAAGPASATLVTLAGNLGPGDSYNTSAAWFLVDNNGPFTGATKLAVSFIAPSDATLVSLRAAVLYYGTTANQTYYFSFAADNGSGAPGATVETFTTAPVSTGSSFNTLLTFNSTLNVALTAGAKYWLVMDDFTNSTSSVRTGAWYLNNTGAGGLSYFNGTWNAISNPAPAFDVLAEVSAVPEASAVLMLTAALAAALTWTAKNSLSCTKRK